MVTQEIINRCLFQFFNDKNFKYKDYPILSNGSDCCEDDKTAFMIEPELFLRQTAQVHMEYDVRSGDETAVWTRGRSLRNEPRAGDGRHDKDFPLAEWESTTAHIRTRYESFADDIVIWHEDKKLIPDDLVSLIRFNFTFMRKMLYTRYNDTWVNKFECHAFPYEMVVDKIGDDVSPELEKTLCQNFNIVAVYNYPTELCHFTMGESKPGFCKKVDVLLPGVGETIGSAVRSTDKEFISRRLFDSAMYKGLVAKGMNPDAFNKYLDCNFDVSTVGGGIGLGRLLNFFGHMEPITEKLVKSYRKSM